MNHSFQNPQNNPSFTDKVWIAGFIITLIVGLILFFIASIHVFILILIGVLIACYFRGLGRFIQSKTNWSVGLSLIFSVLFTLIFISALFYFVVFTAALQFVELYENFPYMMENARRLFY